MSAKRNLNDKAYIKGVATIVGMGMLPTILKRPVSRHLSNHDKICIFGKNELICQRFQCFSE